MKTIGFPSLSDLAIAAFKSDEAEKKYEKEIAIEKEKSDSMFDDLVSGKIDFFVQRVRPNRKGEYLVNTWTRSSRQNVSIQLTVWLNNEKKKKFYALSHVNVTSKEDMYEEALADTGVVFGISDRDKEPAFITGFSDAFVR